MHIAPTRSSANTPPLLQRMRCASIGSSDGGDAGSGAPSRTLLKPDPAVVATQYAAIFSGGSSQTDSARAAAGATRLGKDEADDAHRYETDTTLEGEYPVMASCIEPYSDSDEDKKEQGISGGYVTEGLLGTGAFSRVYAGRDPTTWRPVAIKQVLKVPAYATGPVHEFAMARRCIHKHIIEAVACVEDAGEQFLVFEMADEGDLYDRLQVAGEQALARGTCRRYLREAAVALVCCHSNSIVHGDVKLENMLLHQNAVKLCDFGLAAMINEVRVGRPYGTSSYMTRIGADPKQDCNLHDVSFAGCVGNGHCVVRCAIQRFALGKGRFERSRLLLHFRLWWCGSRSNGLWFVGSRNAHIDGWVVES